MPKYSDMQKLIKLLSEIAPDEKQCRWTIEALLAELRGDHYERGENEAERHARKFWILCF